jgi:hypothetical protein
MIFYRRFQERSLNALERHLNKFNKLEIKSDAAIEDQPDECLYGVDVSMKLYQTFSQRLWRVFYQGPIAFWDALGNASIKYPFGGEEASDFLGLTNSKVIYFSWKYCIKDAFRDFFHHIKEACKKFCWIDWVITLDSLEMEKFIQEENKMYDLDINEREIWNMLCPIEKFTNRAQITEFTKIWIKKTYCKEPEVIYNDRRQQVEVELQDADYEFLKEVSKKDCKSFNTFVNEILQEYIKGDSNEKTKDNLERTKKQGSESGESEDRKGQ